MRKTLEVPTPNENNGTNIFYRKVQTQTGGRVLVAFDLNCSLCFISTLQDNLWSWLETGWNYWIWWYCKVNIIFKTFPLCGLKTPILGHLWPEVFNLDVLRSYMSIENWPFLRWICSLLVVVDSYNWKR